MHSCLNSLNIGFLLPPPLRLAAEFEGRAFFAVVYLEEAHPSDGWTVPAATHSIKQHTQMRERVDAARELEAELSAIYERESALAGKQPPPVLVDTMENRAAIVFGALPERLAIVREGMVVYLGGKGPFEYSLEHCRDALKEVLSADSNISENCA